MTYKEAKLCDLSRLLEEVYQLLGKPDPLQFSTAVTHLRVRERKSPTPSSVARDLRTRLGKFQLAVDQYQREMKALNEANLKERNRLSDLCDPGLL